MSRLGLPCCCRFGRVLFLTISMQASRIRGPDFAICTWGTEAPFICFWLIWISGFHHKHCSEYKGMSQQGTINPSLPYWLMRVISSTVPLMNTPSKFYDMCTNAGGRRTSNISTVTGFIQDKGHFHMDQLQLCFDCDVWIICKGCGLIQK